MKNKITIIAIAILSMSAFSLQAGIRVGVKAGVNLAKAEFNTSAIQTENFTGFQIGPTIELSGLAGLGVDASLLYSKHGIRANLPVTSTKSDYELKVSTLDIPVNLKFKISLADMAGVYFAAGPYISFKLDDQTTFNQIKQDWGNKNFGVGLNFGAGVEIVKHLQLGVNYQLSLNDDYNDFSIIGDFKDIKAKTRIWSITATYFF